MPPVGLINDGENMRLLAGGKDVVLVARDEDAGGEAIQAD